MESLFFKLVLIYSIKLFLYFYTLLILNFLMFVQNNYAISNTQLNLSVCFKNLFDKMVAICKFS